MLKNTLCVAGGGAKTHGCVSMRQNGEDEARRRGGEEARRGGEEEARGISRSVSTDEKAEADGEEADGEETDGEETDCEQAGGKEVERRRRGSGEEAARR